MEGEREEKNKKRCFLGGFFFRPLKMLGEIQIKIVKELINEPIYSNRRDKRSSHESLKTHP